MLAAIMPLFRMQMIMSIIGKMFSGGKRGLGGMSGIMNMVMMMTVLPMVMKMMGGIG